VTSLVEELRSIIRVGTVDEAAARAVVLVAVPWSKTPEALKLDYSLALAMAARETVFHDA
jgi:predicted dinucleotide-binding enzyme